MKRKELEDKFNKDDYPTALIEYEDDKGIAIRLGENLVTGTWLSGDIIVFWNDGEHTILPDEFKLIKYNLWI